MGIKTMAGLTSIKDNLKCTNFKYVLLEKAFELLFFLNLDFSKPTF